MVSSDEKGRGPGKSTWISDAKRAGRLLRNLSLSLAVLSMGLGSLLWLAQVHGIGNRSGPTGGDVFFYLLFRYEPQMLSLSAVGFLALYVLIRWPEWFSFCSPRWNRIGPLTTGQLVGVSLLVVALVSLGRHYAYLDYDTCADESLTHFQSEIFLSGHVLAPIPAKWQPFENAAAIPLLTVHPQQKNWCSEFLPVHSLLSVPATWLGFGGYTCALFLGLNLVLFYHLLRKIWPHHPTRAAVGLMLFAAFPQVLITSMTSYSMETHALLTTVWLLLYISKNETIFLLTPWVGILCMGIHQPHIHCIFAVPFVLRLALERRFFEFFYFCAVYLAGLLFWIGYLHLIRPSSVADGLFNKFGFIPVIQLLIQTGNIALLLAWSPLMLTLLFLLAWLRLHRREAFVACCLISSTLLAGFHLIWPTQGHGWGERFLYPAIPFIIVVCLSAVAIPRLALGRRATMNLVYFSILFALAVGLPYRLWEVHRFQSTYQAVNETITRTNADVVLLDASQIWYGRDLVLNNPSLDNRPVVLSLDNLTPAQVARLKQESLTLKILGMDDLRTTGHPQDYVHEQD